MAAAEEKAKRDRLTKALLNLGKHDKGKALEIILGSLTIKQLIKAANALIAEMQKHEPKSSRPTK